MIALPHRTHAPIHTPVSRLLFAAILPITAMNLASCRTRENSSALADRNVATIEWRAGAPDDTVFGVPADVTVDRRLNRVLVADPGRAAIIELNAVTGNLMRFHRNTGVDQRDQWLSPERVAIAPSGKVIAVYDAGRQAVDVLDSQFAFIRRIQTDEVLINVKALAVSDDTTVVLAAGRAQGGAADLGVHWLVNGHGPLTSCTLREGRGSMPPGGEDAYLARQLVKGGALIVENSSCAVLADAASGNVWRCCPEGAQIIANGPPALMAMTDGIVGHVLTRGPTGTRVWWRFPRVIMLEPWGDGSGFLEVVSEPDKSLLTFYHVDPQHGVNTLASLNHRVRAITPYDRTSFIAIVEPTVNHYGLMRFRYPASMLDAGS